MHFGERHTRVHRFGPSAPPVRPCARACQRTTGSNVSADAVTNIVIIDDIDCTLWTSKESPVALLCRLVNEVAIVISPCIVANNHHIFVDFSQRQAQREYCLTQTYSKYRRSAPPACVSLINHAGMRQDVFMCDHLRQSSARRASRHVLL